MLYNLFVADSNQIKEKVLYEEKIYDDDKGFNTIKFKLARENWERVTFPQYKKNSRKFEIKITPQREMYIDRKSTNSDDENTIMEDSLTDQNFLRNTNKRILGVSSELIISKIEEYIKEKNFSFSWDSIPNFEEEFDYIFKQMSFVYTDLVYDTAATYKKKRNLFKKFWRKKSNIKSLNHGLYMAKLYQEKLYFANENFFKISGISSFLNVEHNNLVKNGCNTDKSRMYFKYGMPDEINGDRIFNSKGYPIYNSMPFQRWYYKKLDMYYYFRGSDLILKSKL